MKNRIILAAIIALLGIAQSSYAFAPKETSRYFNGPKVNNIGTSSATFSLGNLVLSDITDEEKTGIYFEYDESQKVCILIYPTPVECLPKKTIVGSSTVTVTGLKPNTSYWVKYKRDNTIRCITTPCPENGFESLNVEFKTLATSTNTNIGQITKDLRLGMRDKQVEWLQRILIEQGFLRGNVTGYFGNLTRRALIAYQKKHDIQPTGFVGKLTKLSFKNKIGIYFEGNINSFSTSCFADGICSVTIDGKTVVVTRGWSQEVVGALRGVQSIGDLDKKIGAKAKVFAAKTEDGNYTLYGNKDFYIEVQ